MQGNSWCCHSIFTALLLPLPISTAALAYSPEMKSILFLSCAELSGVSGIAQIKADAEVMGRSCEAKALLMSLLTFLLCTARVEAGVEL